jgi:hypothetical protein
MRFKSQNSIQQEEKTSFKTKYNIKDYKKDNQQIFKGKEEIRKEKGEPIEKNDTKKEIEDERIERERKEKEKKKKKV